MQNTPEVNGVDRGVERTDNLSPLALSHKTFTCISSAKTMSILILSSVFYFLDLDKNIR